jgi:predicted RNase H-like HicB family nuclease
MKTEYAVQIIWSPEDAAYLAIPVELPGCVADGQTQEEALANLKVVIEEWIETAKEDGREIPHPMTVEQAARLQQEAQANLQWHIEAEVKKVVHQILSQLMQQQQTHTSWNFRGGLVFDPSENLEIAGGSRRR